MAPDDGIVSMEGVLRRPDGTRRSHDEAVRLFGNRSVWVAELREALMARLSGPDPLSVPPRIFVSYRWGAADDDRWVAELVDELRRRGYVVSYDRTDHDADTTSVPEFVSSIADCHIFLAILDPGYQERIGGEQDHSIADGWVFDEYNNAAALSNAGRLQIIGLWRSGEELPRGFRVPVPGRQGNAVDVRVPGSLTRVLDQLFPGVADPPPANLCERVDRLIRSSHAAAAAGDLEAAFDDAAEAAEILPGIIDGHRQLARVAMDANRAPEGLEAARAALAIEPRSVEMLTAAAACAYILQELDETISLCATALELDVGEATASFGPRAHYLIGNALDDLGQTYAGIAHLEIACRLAPHQAMFCNDIGLAYRHIDDPARALEWFARGLETAPTDLSLLVNRAAAAIEAGDSKLATSAIDELASHHPDHPSAEHLGTTLEQARAAGAERLQLVPRLAARQPVGTVTCTDCAVAIPLASDKELLCSRCGAEAFDGPGRCPYCGADGFVFPQLPIKNLCPYCRDGSLKYEPAP